MALRKALYISSLAGAVLAATAHATAAQEAAPANEQPQYLAQAQSYTDVVVALQVRGYEILELRQTFLGRIRIVAQNDVHVREIVVSRTTGEIKRDIVLSTMNEAETETGGTTTGGETQQATSGSASTSGTASASVSVGGSSVSVGGSGGVSVGVGGLGD